MAKLFFKYGTMGSGKSLDLLKVAYNYEQNGMDTIIFTSFMDDRYGKDIIQSRTGLSRNAKRIKEEDNVFDMVKEEIRGNSNIRCVLVDEVQFFDKKQIYQLIDVVDTLNVPVICYGLRTDFRLVPFEASMYLLSLADQVEELKTICSICGRKKASVNARFNSNGDIVLGGAKIKIGGDDMYKPLCRSCFNEIRKKDDK